jgi:hypothetical protein
MDARGATVAVDRDALAGEQPHTLSRVGGFGLVAAPGSRHLPAGRQHPMSGKVGQLDGGAHDLTAVTQVAVYHEREGVSR